MTIITKSYEELFNLTQEQQHLTTELNKIIKYQIFKQNNFISFAKYMELALYQPEFGYYNNLLYKFGKNGDFITAPKVSQLFGLALTNQIVELQEQGMPANILEFGSGDGQLAIDILAKIGHTIDHYYILELSASLIKLQQQRLKQYLPQYLDKVHWLSELPTTFDGLMLANEVLDAQPCEQIFWQNQIIMQVGVGVNTQDELMYKSKKSDGDLLELALKLKIQEDNYRSELNLVSHRFIKTLADILQKGCILIIDYGSAAQDYYALNKTNGTIRGFFRQHQLDDILKYPGLIDITADIDFTAITNSAIESNLDFIGYTSQANFLINCKILDFLTFDKNDEITSLKLNQQLLQLTSPNEMGERFKVLGLSKNINFANWIGFVAGDISHTL